MGVKRAMDENDIKSSLTSELELLQQQKLKLEIKEQRHWLIKMPGESVVDTGGEFKTIRAEGRRSASSEFR
jgi:hypothetical protein